MEELSTEKKIDLIENQIHSINIKLNEPEKKGWWKKNSSLLISIAALATSIVFSFYGFHREKTKEESESYSEKIKKVEALALKLTEVAEKNFKITSEIPQNNWNMVSVYYNIQRNIHLKELDNILSNVDHKFPPNIYALIGNEFKQNGEYELSKDYFKAELKSANISSEKVFAYRNLSILHSIPKTNIFNLDSAHYYWNKALSECNNIIGEQYYDHKCYTFYLWASNELYINNNSFASQLIDSAYFYCTELHDYYPNKQNLLTILEQLKKSDKLKVTNNLFATLLGEWKSTKRENQQTKVYFSNNPSGWFCTIEIYNSNKITFYASGPMIAQTDAFVIFNINGTKKELGSIYPVQTIGSVKFYPNKRNQNKISLVLNSFNSNEQKFTIYKN